MYVYIDSWHLLEENETTACGIVVPHGTDWVSEVPEDEPIHCGPLATPEKPAAKAKAKKAKKG